MNTKRERAADDIDQLLAAGAAQELARHSSPAFVRSVAAALPDTGPAPNRQLALLLPGFAVLLAGLIASGSGVIAAFGHWLRLGAGSVMQFSSSALAELFRELAAEPSSALLVDPLVLVGLIVVVTAAPLWLFED